jgi:ABC-type cobalamin/Fe3+-siderophores transport system ATPase subunit
MDYCINAENVYLKACGKTILKDVTLRVKRGEFVTILGPSGAGKTSLLKVLLGFHKPSSGSVFMAGEKVEGPGIKLVRKRTGYMPQSFEEAKNFPILAGDVVAMSADTEASRDAVRELGINSLMKKSFSSLSGGEKQKVMLAMVLARHPGIMLLDEPNLNLDMKSYCEFLELVEKVHKKYSHTVLFVTHLISHIPVSCKRIVVMKNGCVVHDGTKAGVLRKKDMTEFLYG